MAEYLLSEICDAVATTLGTAVGMKETESYNGLHEAEAADDLPMIQVYPEGGTPNPDDWGERTSFQGGVRVMQFEIRADLYAAVRGILGENMEIVTDMIDALITVLQAVGRAAPPYFGTGSEAIDAFTWSFRRATFQYSNQRYAGVRFTFLIRVF